MIIVELLFVNCYNKRNLYAMISTDNFFMCQLHFYVYIAVNFHLFLLLVLIDIFTLFNNRNYAIREDKNYYLVIGLLKKPGKT